MLRSTDRSSTLCSSTLAFIGALAVGCVAGEPRVVTNLPPALPDAPLAPIIMTGSEEAVVPTRRDDHVETLFGTQVADPYRWLENDSPEVTAWVRAQNAHTRRYLDRIDGIRELRARVEALSAIGDVSRPSVVRLPDGRFRHFYTRRSGRQDQPLLLARDGSSRTARLVLDPNTWSANGTSALDWYHPSEDGRYVAYGRSDQGDEWSTLYVRDVETGEDLPDVLPRARHASVCWEPNGSGFYYTRYPEPGTVPPGEENYRRRLYHHRLGAPPGTDRLVFGDGLALTDFVSCDLSPNGRYLAVRVSKGWSRSEVHVADTGRSPLTFVRVTPDVEAVYRPVVDDETLYLHTNDGAPRYRLLAISAEKPAEPPRTVLYEHATDVLDDVSLVGGDLFAAYLHDGASRLERFTNTGESRGPIELPGLGTASGVSGHPRGKDAFFAFESFLSPKAMYRVELSTGSRSRWEHVPALIDGSAYRVERGYATSRDGTRIPYFRVFKDGARTAAPAPTLLYGYGGFNVNVTPRYASMTFALLERGVVLCQAVLRGGGEFGEEWHRAGRLDKKQNVFDDFIAVAEHLIASGATSPERLAISGRSNGGLLVAAAVTQRPDLFRAAVAGVPLADMLRFDRFLIGKLWTTEYGSPGDPEAFRWLHAYSPYHRVRDDVGYPAVLVTTGEHDGRVHPLHARKLAAALQNAGSSGRPVLLRSESDAGHGAGKPRHLAVGEQTDVYAFLLHELGVMR